tara:strand:- start:318 stop:902 length:585 start_codon:yes stop_codon:yes gene_type:complete
MATPYDHKLNTERQINEWHIPLSTTGLTLKDGLDSMGGFKLEAEDVPLIIKLVENPKYDIGLFAGNVSLYNHDSIHLLLGRGLRVKDEAFVIGFTMGSTKKMWRWRRNLYMFCAKYLFPEGYSFGEQERFVFNMGVMAGSQCSADLSKADCFKLKNFKIDYVRKLLDIDKKLLKYCYEVEKKCFPDSPESQRLL